jgi:hypothetical protein
VVNANTLSVNNPMGAAITIGDKFRLQRPGASVQPSSATTLVYGCNGSLLGFKYVTLKKGWVFSHGVAPFFENCEHDITGGIFQVTASVARIGNGAPGTSWGNLGAANPFLGPVLGVGAGLYLHDGTVQVALGAFINGYVVFKNARVLALATATVSLNAPVANATTFWARTNAFLELIGVVNASYRSMFKQPLALFGGTKVSSGVVNSTEGAFTAISNLNIDSSSCCGVVCQEGGKAKLVNVTGTVAGAGTVGLLVRQGSFAAVYLTAPLATTITGAAGDTLVGGSVDAAFAITGGAPKTYAALNIVDAEGNYGYTGLQGDRIEIAQALNGGL